MPKVKANGINIHYIEQGKGDVILFIPGLGGDVNLFYKQTPYFAENFRVIVMDNRGAGKTDKPEGDYKMKTLSNDVNALLDALDINEPINLVGVSFGGVIAQSFIHDYPKRVKKLVIVSSGLSGGDPNYTPMSPEVAERIMNPGETTEEKIDVIINYYFHTKYIEENPWLKNAFIKKANEREQNGEGKTRYMSQLAAASDARPYYEWLADIKCPVLVMHGAEDRIWPLENARTLKRGIGDNCELFVMEDTEHMMIQTKADAFNEKLHDFLNK